WTRGGADPTAFPERIAVPGKPVAVAVAPPTAPSGEAAGVDPDAKRHGIVCLTKDAKREAKLVRLVPGLEGFAAASTAELERLVNDPLRLAVADVGGEPGPEVLFVVPGEGLKVLTTRGGKLVALGDAEA